MRGKIIEAAAGGVAFAAGWLAADLFLDWRARRQDPEITPDMVTEPA